MGWETRSGRSYYYRKERDGDRVRSVYVGAGELAGHIAFLIEHGRQEADLKRERLRTFHEEGAAILGAYDALARFVRVHVAAILTLEGFRQHKGQWRRRRRPLPMAKSKKQPTPFPAGPVHLRLGFRAGAEAEAWIKGDPADADNEAAQALLARCQVPEPEAADLAALRRWMKRDGVMLKAEALAEEAQGLALSPQRNAVLESAAFAGLRDLRDRMGYADAEPAERLLIVQVCTAWAILQAEQAHLTRKVASRDGYSLDAADALDRRVSHAHTRFLRAIESLEKVRALRSMTAARRPVSPSAEPERILPSPPPRASPRDPVKLPDHAGDGAAHPAEVPALASPA